MDLSTRLRNAMETSPDAIAMEYRRREFAMSEVSAFGDRVISLLEQAGAPADAKIGIVQRNRPLHAAAILGILTRGRSFTSIYSMQSVESLAEELRQSRFAAVIADADDWKDPVIDAARSVGTACIRLDNSAFAIEMIPGAEKCGDGPFDLFTGEPGLEILSSGTTGKPKRILFPFRMLVRAVESVMYQFSGSTDITPHIEVLPFTSIGGMCCLVANPIIGRYTALLEKFNVADWVEAARRLRPTVASGPPTIARMLIDAKINPEDVSSIKYWFGGGAAFPPELQDEFKAAYGIQTLWAYGATEFCGTLMSWTPDTFAKYGESKRGSVGRCMDGLKARIVDVETGEVLPPGQQGYLEALIPDVSPDWIRTTDLMLIDEDGYAWHFGRGDGAILRGGFKVLPEKTVQALLDHPAVLDAGVVGLPDRRLGQVPVAAVELRKDQPPPTEDDLHAHCRERLVAHQRPVRIVIMDALPRTTTLKVGVSELRKLLEAQLSDSGPDA